MNYFLNQFTVLVEHNDFDCLWFGGGAGEVQTVC